MFNCLNLMIILVLCLKWVWSLGHRPVIIKRPVIGSKGGSEQYLSCKVFHDLGLELAIDPLPPPRGNFVHYDFLKLHYIRHKIKDVSPLRVAALTCNSMLYTLPPKIALNVPDNVLTMTCSYIFAC